MRKTTFSLRTAGALVLALVAVVTLSNACKKVDETIDEALNFEGVFKTGDGYEVTLDGENT